MEYECGQVIQKSEIRNKLFMANWPPTPACRNMHFGVQARTIKITKHYPPPSPPRSINRAGPGDGGGLRWGWTKYIPPHPLPLPCLRRSGFAQAGTKGRGRYRQVLRILFLIHEKGLCLIVPNFS